MRIEHRWIRAGDIGTGWTATTSDVYDEAAARIFQESAADPQYLGFPSGSLVAKVTIKLSDGTKLQYRRAK